MSSAAAASYDSVPYEGAAQGYTHPEALAIAGALRGVTPKDVETCKVLEIGSALGGNLIPMALTLPRATFVGVDVSERQVAEGNARVRALGLSNVEFLEKDVTQINESFGQFDYIICHGVFSWVPDKVRDSILEVLSRNLAPSGIAYMSYNVFPGWFLKSLVRKMLLFRLRGEPDPQSRAGEIREFLQELMSLFGAVKKSHSDVVSSVIRDILDSPAHYLVHEYLEEENQPYYFHEVVERAARHGLQYLCEQKNPSLQTLVPRDVWIRLKNLAKDEVELEQYGDFLLNGTFRRSLFCSSSLPLSAEPAEEEIERLMVIARCRPKSQSPQVSGSEPETFIGRDRQVISTNDPYVIAVLTAAFTYWPRAVSFPELLSRAGLLFGKDLPREDLAAKFTQALVQCHGARLVLFRLFQPGFAAQPGVRPVATPLVRFQAGFSSSVTNVLHESIPVGDLDRFLLIHLDGTRTREELAASLEDAVCRGDVEVEGVAPEAIGKEFKEELPRFVDQCIRRMASQALFVA